MYSINVAKLYLFNYFRLIVECRVIDYEVFLNHDKL